MVLARALAAGPEELGVMVVSAAARAACSAAWQEADSHA